MATYNLRAGLTPANVGIIYIDDERTLDLNRQFTESATMYAPNADTVAVRVLDSLQGTILTKITDNPTANEARYLTPILALSPYTALANQGIVRRISDGLYESNTLGTGPPSGSAGGDLTGTYPNPTIGALKVTDAKVAAANKDGTTATPSMRTLGTGSTQAAAGDHTHAGGGSGHAITDEGGSALTSRPTLNFAGYGVTATDNAGSNRTDITIPSNGFPAQQQSATGALTVGADTAWLADATTAPFTLTLPLSPGAGALVVIKKTDASTNAVTIAPQGGGLIDRLSTYVLAYVNDSVIIQCSAGNTWKILGQVLLTSQYGHLIADEGGAALTSRPTLNFIGAGVTATDNSGTNRTDVTIAGGAGHTIQDEGSPLTARTGLNFVGAGVAATDDSVNNRTNVTINAGSAADATTIANGVVRLAGDLGGSGTAAAAPKVLGLTMIKEAPLNPKDPAYGALFDDSTNDVTALQAALNAVPASGGTVIFPGFTRVNAALAPKTKTRIIGTGRNGSGVRWTANPASAAPLFEVSNVAETEYHDLTIDGRGFGNADRGIRAASGADSITVMGCTFQNFTTTTPSGTSGGPSNGAGIYCWNSVASKAIRVHRSRFIDCVDGAYIENPDQFTEVVDCHGYCTSTKLSRHGVFYRCAAPFWSGALMQGCSWKHVMQDTSLVGIDGHAFDVFQAQGVSIVNCHAEDCITSCFHPGTGAHGFSVVGCTGRQAITGLYVELNVGVRTVLGTGASTTLASSFTPGASTVSITSGTGVPAMGSAVIGQYQVFFTYPGSGTTLTVIRTAEPSVALGSGPYGSGVTVASGQPVKFFTIEGGVASNCVFEDTYGCAVALSYSPAVSCIGITGKRSGQMTFFSDSDYTSFVDCRSIDAYVTNAVNSTTSPPNVKAHMRLTAGNNDYVAGFQALATQTSNALYGVAANSNAGHSINGVTGNGYTTAAVFVG